jgi:hypothetical protein
MPNGGTHHCAEYCCHFDNEMNTCLLRGDKIEYPFWTSCKNFDQPDAVIVGPLCSIVSQVRGGGGGYNTIPYFDGCRVETVQKKQRGDTVVYFTDRNGKYHEFPMVADYMEFYRNNKPDSD